MSYRLRTKTRYGETRGVECDGYSFMSKLEASVYQILKLRQVAKEIEILQTQDHVYLTDARIGYVPDFKCKDLKTEEIFWCEAKGFPNDRWPTIKKLWKYYGPGRLEIWRGSYQKPFLEEIIVPQQKVKK